MPLAVLLQLVHEALGLPFVRISGCTRAAHFWEVRAVNKCQLNIANWTKKVDQKRNWTKFGWTSGKLNNSRFINKQWPKKSIEQLLNWTKHNWTEELNKYCSIDYPMINLSSLKECLEVCENKIFLRLLWFFSLAAIKIKIKKINWTWSFTQKIAKKFNWSWSFTQNMAKIMKSSIWGQDQDQRAFLKRSRSGLKKVI